VSPAITELRCSACGAVAQEGMVFCGNCGNKLIVEETATKKVDSMRHIISAVNSWSFDVPAFFGNGKLLENNHGSTYYSTYYYKSLCRCMLQKFIPGCKPPLSLFAKKIDSLKIDSLSDYIAYCLKGSRILNQKMININGLSAEYDQRQVGKTFYAHDAYLETNRLFYHFCILVPLVRGLEYQEQLDAFIYSIKLG
jgi:hypothetical protein